MKQVDVLVYSGTFFAQTNPRIARMLQERAQAGVRVRLCFGDPEGEAVRIRGHEEGIGDTLAAKIRASLTSYRGLVSHPGCEVRLHDTTLHNSIFRYDDHLLVDPPHLGPASQCEPALPAQTHRQRRMVRSVRRELRGGLEHRAPLGA